MGSLDILPIQNRPGMDSRMTQMAATFALSALGKRIIHFHFIDGAPRGHLAWGDGVLDMKGYLTQLEEHDYEGYLSLEITDGRYFMEPWKSVEQSVKQLFSVIS